MKKVDHQYLLEFCFFKKIRQMFLSLFLSQFRVSLPFCRWVGLVEKGQRAAVGTERSEYVDIVWEFSAAIA
jgi:hypothetical protein